MRGEIVARQVITALLRGAPALRDQLAKIAVRVASRRKQHDARAVRERKFRADDELEPRGFRLQMRAHHARDRAFVRDRERVVAERTRAID